MTRTDLNAKLAIIEDALAHFDFGILFGIEEDLDKVIFAPLRALAAAAGDDDVVIRDINAVGYRANAMYNSTRW